MEKAKMSNQRKSAWSMLFEPCTLNGKRAIGTGTPLKREDIPNGFYCYDLYTPEEFPDVQHTIALEGLSNYANGSIILTEPLEFQGKTELCMENLILHEETPMITLEYFVELNQKQDQCLGQEMDLGWTQLM